MRLLFRLLFICFLLIFVFASCTKTDLGSAGDSTKIAFDGGGAAVGNGGGSQTAGVLTAGEWNDFDN